MPERFDYGPLRTYEITWSSGHVERLQAHQVLAPQSDPLAGMFSGVATKPRGRWLFHGEFDGHWRLVLSASEGDIRTVRDVTGGEHMPGAAPATGGGGHDA